MKKSIPLYVVWMLVAALITIPCIMVEGSSPEIEEVIAVLEDSTADGGDSDDDNYSETDHDLLDDEQDPSKQSKDGQEPEEPPGDAPAASNEEEMGDTAAVAIAAQADTILPEGRAEASAFPYDPQPASKEGVQQIVDGRTAAIAALDDDFWAGFDAETMDIDDFVPPLPRWEFAIAVDWVPQGYNQAQLADAATGTVYWTLELSVMALAGSYDAMIDLFTIRNNGSDVSGTGYHYFYYPSSAFLIFTADGTYEVTGEATVDTRIAVQASKTVSVTFRDVTISNSSDAATPATDGTPNSPLALLTGAVATLTLEDTNSLSAAAIYSPAIHVPPGTSLTIDGDGELDAKAGNFAAGIGGHSTTTAFSVGHYGAITINSGTITALGGSNGAAIGSSSNYAAQTKATGVTTITGGTVNATGGPSSAGIGGAYHVDGGAINITGGTVTATGGADYSAGIGGGHCAGEGTITIGGNADVTATTAYGAGIGSSVLFKPDNTSYLGSVTITGSAVVHAASTGGAGIGGGANSDNGSIVISGSAKVTAESSHSAAAIGGGGYIFDGYAASKGTSISIQGSPEITAVSVNGAAIGAGLAGSIDTIAIGGGTISATSAKGAGIGGGCSNASLTTTGGNISITGGDIIAVSTDGAGIGGGGTSVTTTSGAYGGNAGTITVAGGAVIAQSANGDGIGGGYGATAMGSGADLSLAAGVTLRAYSRDAVAIRAAQTVPGSSAYIINATLDTGDASALGITAQFGVDTVDLALPANYRSFGYIGVFGSYSHTTTEAAPRSIVKESDSALALESDNDLAAHYPVTFRTTHYSVTYNANGGTGGYADASLTSGNTYMVLSQAATGITRTNYRFTGWNTNPYGTGTSYAAGNTFPVSGNAILYAQWIRNSSGGGSSGGSSSGSGSSGGANRSGSTSGNPSGFNPNRASEPEGTGTTGAAETADTAGTTGTAETTGNTGDTALYNPDTSANHMLPFWAFSLCSSAIAAALLFLIRKDD